ncbi:hypothetical protein BSM4216_1906 [Bacillus smithii]|nr:hypothetical protein BSM4216_1906 [Bacillus smithii]
MDKKIVYRFKNFLDSRNHLCQPIFWIKNNAEINPYLSLHKISQNIL